jgi:hypothetical protein
MRGTPQRGVFQQPVRTIPYSLWSIPLDMLLPFLYIQHILRRVLAVWKKRKFIAFNANIFLSPGINIPVRASHPGF